MSVDLASRSASLLLLPALLLVAAPGVSQESLALRGGPILDLGEEQGVLAVTSVSLGENRVAVADPTTREVSVYTIGGDLQLSVGGPGEGPGEFASLASVVRCGSAWAAWDPRLDRLTVVRGSELEGTFRLPEIDGGLPQRPSCFEERLLVPYLSVGEPSLGSYRPDVSVHQFSLDGRHQRRIRTIPWDERTRHTSSDGPRLLGKVTVLVPTQNGFWVGTGDDGYSLVHYGWEGEQTGAARLDVPPRPVLRPDLEHMWNRQLRAAEQYGPDVVDGLRRNQQALEYPEHYPPYESAFLDEQSSLWVKRYAGPRDNAESWDIFDSAGAHMGTFRGPDGFRLTDARGSLAAGVWRDEYDVERARVYRLSGGG